MMWMCLINLNTMPQPHPSFLLFKLRISSLMNPHSIFNILSSLQLSIHTSIPNMSMFPCFFNKPFKASKCATLLKLTIPRIKLLRNKKEVQLKQMRSDIAMLLEAGQESKAGVQVEHVMREENMMAAQDIIQQICELIVAHVPIIQSQRKCPLDLKEAISSICFAAPRCSDLPELLQVRLLFVSKYGKKFVSAATELAPNCSVNRQLIELLSVQAPSQEKKLNLLKEIAVENKLDWDSTASETKFFKKHEELLKGPIQFSSKSKLPEEKHNEVDLHSPNHSGSLGPDKDKTHTSFGTRTEANFDLQEVLVAAEAAENAAAEARSAANLAQVCFNKLTKKNSAHVPDSSFENPFCASVAIKSETEMAEQNTADDYDGGGINDAEFEHAFPYSHSSNFPSFETLKEDYGSNLHNHSVLDHTSSHHQFKRLPSVDDYSGFSYPNLFTSKNINVVSHTSDNR